MSPLKLLVVSQFFHRNGFVFLSKLITFFIRFIFCCYLPGGVTIGRMAKLGYGGLGIVIHDRVVIGIDCHIDQGVTIGGTSKKIGVPILGNHVYAGAGSKILGPVTIGNNVVIGANAVVVSDVPDNCLVVGVPAKIIKRGVYKSDYV
jgi:serine O-acetyltransferase